MPTFVLQTADGTAKVTCSVDRHEAPLPGSLGAKIQALAGFTNTPTTRIEYPYTHAFPALRDSVRTNVVPTGAGDT